MVEIDNETAQFFWRAHRYPIPKLAQETESPMLEPTWVPTGLALATPFPSDRLTEENNDTTGQSGGDGPTPTPAPRPQQHKGEEPANAARPNPEPCKALKVPQTLALTEVSRCTGLPHTEQSRKRRFRRT